MESIIEWIGTVLVAASIPSAVFAFIIRRFEKRMDEDKREKEEREQARRKYENFNVQVLTAMAKLSEATAIALQTGKCNGEITKAMAYLDEVRHAQRAFLVEKSIDEIF